jgi:chromosomal replication initiation ATPase DnaA
MDSSSVIFDPWSRLTPSEHLAAAAHHQRQARIADAARRFLESRSRVLQKAEPKPPPQETVEAWADRQKQIYKEPWFSIVEEIEEPKPRYPMIEEIQAASAKHFGVSRRDILSARRTAQVVRPRQIAMYLAKTLTLRSLPEIGRRFGGRDHTTVLHAVRKIGALVVRDAAMAQDIEIISSVLPKPSLAEASL